MSCNVMPLKKHAEISYRVRCVSVENERVFGDVYVTQQTRNRLSLADGYHFPPVFKKRRSNLIEEPMVCPDFFELNKKKPTRRVSALPVERVRKFVKRSKSMGDENFWKDYDYSNDGPKVHIDVVKKPKVYPAPLTNSKPPKDEVVVTSLVDQLLLDIYGLPAGDRGRSESDSTASSLRPRPQHQYLQKARLLLKNRDELEVLVLNLTEHISHTGGLLVRQLRRKDYLTGKRDKQCDIITAHLQAHSPKRIEDTKMRFSLTPQPGESGFIQWLDAMKMVARLQGGIPPEFRKRLWLTLAERHLEQRGVDWKQAEKVCFNEWSNPDDEELGIQIVKDLHRTGCSLFCGAAGRDNQAVLRRVLLGFARWNKSVGYCQGLNVLAALVLQVMDRAESPAVKVMIYLIEGVLPEGYFADNLRGLSVDMAVFRDLLRSRLPKLSKHLEALQTDAKDKATGSSYEPPLTNVFTMQWFLTLFCHCLPQEAVLRVWDLIFLEGDEVLLRTALVIWEGLSDRIMTVTSADEFYSIMGVLTREMLEFTDTNNLIKNIVSIGPLHGVTGLREKHRYNITPWARKLSDDDDSDTEEDERLAVAAAMFSMAQRLKKVDRLPSTVTALQAMAPSSDRERLALDISTLKQQYAKLRERQRQAHIILSAACARQSMVPTPTSQAMNHLLVGKNALVTGKNRPLSLPSGTPSPKTRPTALHSPRGQGRKDKQGVTLHWKDTKRAKQKSIESPDVAESSGSTSLQLPQETILGPTSPKRSNADSDSDSTSTELCDEPDRMSDVDSEDLTSVSESYVMATEETRQSDVEVPRGSEKPSSERSLNEIESTSTFESKRETIPIEEDRCLADISIAKITDQIRRLSAEGDNNTLVPQASSAYDEKFQDDLSMDSIDRKGETLLESKRDYVSDASAIRRSLGLDDYDYMSYSCSAVEARDDKISTNDDGLPKGRETREKIEETNRNDDTVTKIDKVEENPVGLPRENSGVFSEYPAASLEKDYDRTIGDTETVKGSAYETTLNFSSSLASSTRLYGQTREVDSLISSPASTAKFERKFYTKTFEDTMELESSISGQPDADSSERKFCSRMYQESSKVESSISSPSDTIDAERKLYTKTYDVTSNVESSISTPSRTGNNDRKLYTNTYEDNDKVESSISGPPDAGNAERKFYSKTYQDTRKVEGLTSSPPDTADIERKFYTKTYQDTSKVESLISSAPDTASTERKFYTTMYQDTVKADSLIGGPGDAASIERKFYSKTYVMGHLPISPITVDQKLSKMSETSHGMTNITGLAQDTCTNPEITLEGTVFGDRSSTVQSKIYQDTKKSPKTPESTKSFSSGETMGPDSKPSSLTVSPRTPVRSDSRDFLLDKSGCSSVSSDSKTLIVRSVDSDSTRDSSGADTKKASYEKSSPSTPISTDSLRNKSDTSPKFVISSSSDSCSPSKVKSSERSFSSDLQSPISANSIKYTSNYNKRGQDNLSGSPMDLSSATSPFYPIAHPNQKTPSPYNATRRRCSMDSTETSPEQKSSSSKESNKYLGYQSKFDTNVKSVETLETESTSRKNDSYVRPQFNAKKEDSSSNLASRASRVSDFDVYESSSSDYYRKDKDYVDDNADDPLSEKDVVPSLPNENMEKRYLSYNYRHRDRSKILERSSSSLERRFADLKSSASTDEFATSIAKKRSSDILEDIKHLEAKALSDGSPDTGLLTKKTSYIWEDLKNLEARRQDTFSNSARNFSKNRLEIPDISVTGESRKSYIVQPKMNIDENSDSILKTISCNKDNGDSDDGRESKLGVWTKVKPRKKGNNGRRSSDRALKIIQENSAILHKILACQAKKRLPDLEEISKEITISPINEEISKIFSPILEKMGLNEHEINEELARINFKDFDNMTATSVSEFDAKINDELSKLSLIDDSEQIDHFDVDEIISHEYLDAREALIDRKINEELSKLLANYEENSPPSMVNVDTGSSSQNISELEGLDLTSISTNVFSYKSSNDSIETRSDLGSTQIDPTIATEKFSQYVENVLPYTVSKYHDNDLSPKSDIDIYRELEKLDKISSAQVLPDPSLEIPKKDLSSIPYVPNTSPYAESSSLRYAAKTSAYDTSPLKTSYDSYKSFDFKTKLSPKKPTTNPFSASSYEKSILDTSFEYINHKPGISTNAYDLHLKSPVLTKESLEFRVRYEEETPRQTTGDYLSLQTDSVPVINSNKGSSFYYSNGNNKPITPTKYVPKEERCMDTVGSSLLEYSSETSDLLRRKYDPLSPKEYAHSRTSEYEMHLGTLPPLESETDVGSYLPKRHRDYSALSPSRQFPEQHFPSNHYASKLSPGLGDETKRPVSHPEFPGKVNVGKYTELPDRGASCYKKSSLSLGNIGHANKVVEEDYGPVTSPKAQFCPFPIRNAPRKPKELTLKLGLYSPKSSEAGQLKRS